PAHSPPREAVSASTCKPVRAPRPPWRSSRPSFGGGFSLPNARTSAPGGKAAGDPRICSAPPKPSSPPKHNRQDSNEPEPVPPPEDGSGPGGDETSAARSAA